MKKIVLVVIAVLVIALAAAAYLFSVNSRYFTTVANVEAVAQGYVIRFADPEGQPVSGVMAKVCDETSCVMITSGEDGTAPFDGELKAWELQILTVPEGYAFLPDEVFKLDANGGETVITLNRG